MRGPLNHRCNRWFPASNRSGTVRKSPRRT